MSEEKSATRTPIMVSMQLHERLNTMKQQLQKIIGNKFISLEKTIEVLLMAKPLDVILEDMIIEANPTIFNEPSKKDKEIERLQKRITDLIVEYIHPNKLSDKDKKDIDDYFEQFSIILKSL